MELTLASIISISMFFIGFIIRERIIKHRTNKDLQTMDRYLIWYLNKFASRLELQISGFRSLSNNLRNEEYRNWLIVPDLQPSIILEKQETLFKILIHRKRGDLKTREDLYNRIIDMCYSLQAIQTESNRLYDESDQKITNLELELDNTGTLLYQAMVKIQMIKKPNEVEKDILTIYEQFQNMTKSSRLVVYSGFTIPLGHLIVTRDYENAEEILKITSMYNKDYEFYKTTWKQTLNKVEEFSSNLESLRSSLIETLTAYKSLKTKSNLL